MNVTLPVAYNDKLEFIVNMKQKLELIPKRFSFN